MPDITRRDFLKLVKGAGIAAGAGALAAPILAYLYPTNLEIYPSEPVLVCAEEELPEGESKIVAFGRYPALVINLGGRLKAYSAACTHFACTVKWKRLRDKSIAHVTKAISTQKMAPSLAARRPKAC